MYFEFQVCIYRFSNGRAMTKCRSFCTTTVSTTTARLQQYLGFSSENSRANSSQLLKGVNPLPDTPILGSSNSASNKDMMSEIWTNGDTIIRLSRKHCGKRRNCSLLAISPLSTMFSKAVCC